MSFDCICQPKLDERLACDADTFGFLIDGLQQIDREVHVHALDLAPRAAGLREIEVRGQAFASVVQGVELYRRQRFSRPGTALLLSSAPGGPRRYGSFHCGTSRKQTTSSALSCQ